MAQLKAFGWEEAVSTAQPFIPGRMSEQDNTNSRATPVSRYSSKEDGGREEIGSRQLKLTRETPPLVEESDDKHQPGDIDNTD